MSNDISKVLPILFAQALPVLRSNCNLARAVNADYSDDAKQKGDTISIPLASAMTVTDVVPGPYAPDPQSVAPTVAKIPLNMWKESAFTLTNKQVSESINGVMPMQLQAAVAALATYINTSIWANYTSAYGIVGTAGTTPFSTVTDAINARKQLSVQLAPVDNRVMIVDPLAEANALALAGFAQMQMSGDKNVVTEGDLGRKYGFDWASDQVGATHTASTVTAGALTANGATSVGSLTVSLAKATNGMVLIPGDILTFAGDAQTYAVVAAATLIVGNTTVSVVPAIKVAKTGGEAVTLTASHTVNLAMHRDAIGFASRVLEDENFGANPNHSISMVDPVSKLALRVSFRQEFERSRFAVSMLWGSAMVRPDLAVRVLG